MMGRRFVSVRETFAAASADIVTRQIFRLNIFPFFFFSFFLSLIQSAPSDLSLNIKKKNPFFKDKKKKKKLKKIVRACKAIVDGISCRSETAVCCRHGRRRRWSRSRLRDQSERRGFYPSSTEREKNVEAARRVGHFEFTLQIRSSSDAETTVTYKHLPRLP